MLLRDLNLKSGESEDEKEVENANQQEEKKTPTSSLLLHEQKSQDQHFRSHKVHRKKKRSHNGSIRSSLKSEHTDDVIPGATTGAGQSFVL